MARKTDEILPGIIIPGIRFIEKDSRMGRCRNCGKLLQDLVGLDLFCSEECRNEKSGHDFPDRDNCVFCQIVAKISEAEDTIRHPGGVISFVPLYPVTDGHRIFVPHQHVQDAAHYPAVTGRVFAVASAYAAVAGKHFNLITSAGRQATQTIFHLHVHYVPREDNDGLLLPWSEH